MYYAFICHDEEDSLEKRKSARTEHLARLEQLQETGRLLLAGPFPAIDSEDPGPAGFTGSLIVAEFESLDEARRWADEEPYLQAGVYREVIVLPFKKTLP